MKKVFKICNTVCRTALLLSVMLTAALFTGCRKKVSLPKKQGIIAGFTQIGAESAWRTCNTKSITEAAEKNDIQLIYFNAEQKQANQIKALRSFIAYQVDVIIFVPIVQEGWDNVLIEAREAGIPVLVVDRKIKTKEPNLYAGYIGTDGYQEGVYAADFLLKRFKNSKGKVNILQICGTPGASVTEDRDAGFKKQIGKDSRFEIIASLYGDFLKSRGEEIMATILEQNSGLTYGGKKIDVIFSQNDAMTLGIIDVLKKNHYRPGIDVTIVSIDAEQAAIDAIKNGQLNCSVECCPTTGEQVMQLVKKLAAKEEIPAITPVPGIVFDDTMDLSTLPERGY